MPAPARLSRRAILLGAGGVAAARLAGLPAVSAQDGFATPDLQVGGEDEAVAILQRAAQALAGLETFAFELETTRGSSTIFMGFELDSVEGVVRRPMDLQAEVNVSTPIGAIQVGAISLDGTFYIQDPLSAGAWMELGEMGEVQALINPDILILNAIRLVQDAEITGTEKVGGVETTVVEGTVDFSFLAEAMGSADEQVAGLLAGTPVDVIFWIDDQDIPVEVEIFGPILASESDDVVRVVSLYDINEPVDIEKPEVVSTPTM